MELFKPSYDQDQVTIIEPYLLLAPLEEVADFDIIQKAQIHFTYALSS